MSSLSRLAAENPLPLAAAFFAAALTPLALRLLPLVPRHLPHASGLLPRRFPSLLANLDPAVVLLFVPVCALMLALLFEIARVALRQGTLPGEAPPHARAIPHWQDAGD